MQAVSCSIACTLAPMVPLVVPMLASLAWLAKNMRPTLAASRCDVSAGSVCRYRPRREETIVEGIWCPAFHEEFFQVGNMLFSKHGSQDAKNLKWSWEGMYLIKCGMNLIYVFPVFIESCLESLILIRSAMFGATFNLVTRVRIPYFVETLKDGSLEINSLALNNCFSYRNVFQNSVNAFVKNGLKKPVFFFSKSSQFRVVWTIQFCSNFTSMWPQILVK